MQAGGQEIGAAGRGDRDRLMGVIQRIVRVRREVGDDDPFVLRRVERAGRVDDAPARPDDPARRLEQPLLPRGATAHVAGGPVGGGAVVAGEHGFA